MPDYVKRIVIGLHDFEKCDYDETVIAEQWDKVLHQPKRLDVKITRKTYVGGRSCTAL